MTEERWRARASARGFVGFGTGAAIGLAGIFLLNLFAIQIFVLPLIGGLLAGLFLRRGALATILVGISFIPAFLAVAIGGVAAQGMGGDDRALLMDYATFFAGGFGILGLILTPLLWPRILRMLLLLGVSTASGALGGLVAGMTFVGSLRTTAFFALGSFFPFLIVGALAGYLRSSSQGN